MDAKYRIGMVFFAQMLGRGRLLDGLGLDEELAVADREQGPAAGLELALEDEAGQGIDHGLLMRRLSGRAP